MMAHDLSTMIKGLVSHPPAFPVIFTYAGETVADSGMQLRDWFAGGCLSAMLSRHDILPDAAAVIAYQHADAMMAQREKGKA